MGFKHLLDRFTRAQLFQDQLNGDAGSRDHGFPSSPRSATIEILGHLNLLSVLLIVRSAIMAQPRKNGK